MSSNLYASVAEFKDRMGITSDERDFAIDRVLEGASRWIDRVTGRRFYANAAPEVRYYTLSNWEYPARWPWPYCDRICCDDILSLTEFATDQNGDGTYETVWTANTHYRLEPLDAVIKGEPFTCIVRNSYSGIYSLPTYPNAIRATGTFGYCTLANCPPNIREATLAITEVDARPILDMAMPGVFTYRLGTEITVTMEGRSVPARAANLLDPFRKHSFVY